MATKKLKSKNKFLPGVIYAIDGFDADGMPLFRPLSKNEDKLKKHVGWTYAVPSNYKQTKKNK